MAYRVNLNNDWHNVSFKRAQKGIEKLARDTLGEAAVNAPKKTGNLRKSGIARRTRNTKNGVAWQVKFGGTEKVRYAKLREHSNNLHPATRFYLKRAAESARAKAGSYFKKYWFF